MPKKNVRRRDRDPEGPRELSRYAKKGLGQRRTGVSPITTMAPMPSPAEFKAACAERHALSRGPSVALRSETLTGVVTLMRTANNFLFIRTADEEDVHVPLHILKRDYKGNDVRLGTRISCVAEYRLNAKRPSATKVLSVLPPG